MEQSLERMEGETECQHLLRTNHGILMEELNVEDILAALSGYLGDGAAERIGAYRLRQEKKEHLLKCVKIHPKKCDYFCQALAGLNPDLFKLIKGRDPTKEEIEFVLGDYPKELKRVIKSKGHTTDKDYDHEIDMPTGYSQLSTTENVDFKELTRRPAQAAQAELQAEHKPIKKEITIKELLETVPDRRVAVEGIGGVGKTTTSQWLCSKWADGNQGSEFSMVFSVRGGLVMDSNRNLSLLGLLKHCTRYATRDLHRLTPACLKTWLEYHSKRVLIIIDGLGDISEFKVKYENSRSQYDVDEETDWSDIIMNVVRRNLLPEAKVVFLSSLDYIGISDSGGNAIRDASKETRTLKRLGELTGSGGLEALPQMLSKNSTLEGQKYDRGLREQSLERREGETKREHLLRKNLKKVMDTLNVEDILAALSGYLGDGEAERIGAYPPHEKKGHLLECVKIDPKKFDYFCQALAGLNADLFKPIEGRDPTKEEIEFVLGDYPKELKRVIKSKGHTTDKDYDHEIDMPTGYIQLSTTENVDFKELTRRHAQAAQAELQVEHKPIKKDIAIKELLETVPGGRSIRRVLVKGRGGVGKTTTSQWFCSEWADGNWGSEFSMVFSVRARVVMNLKRNLSLLDLFKQCTSYTTPVLNRLTPACLKTWLKYHSERVLIIIDGLDEIFKFSVMYENSRSQYDVDQETDWSDIIVNVLRGNLLPEATVVSFSRSFPGLGAISPDRTCEIEGLTSDGVLEYIRTVTRPDKTEIVLATVTGNPVLHSLCSITFYCAVMCKILDEHTAAVGRCMTYGGLTAFIILRYLARSGKGDSSTLSPASIADGNADLIRSLARMAAHAYDTNSRKMVFDDQDLISAKVDQEKARNSGLVNLETRTTTSPYWPKKVQAEFSHMYVCDYLATLGQMYTTGVTSGLAVNRANQTLALVFSHAFSDNESVAALRNCFNDSSLHPGFQQPVLKEKLKRMCSLVGIGLWSVCGLLRRSAPDRRGRIRRSAEPQ